MEERKNRILKNPLIGKILNRETVLYILVGVMTTAVDYGIFTVVNELIKKTGTSVTESSAAANAAAWFAAVIFAYLANKIFVFESREFQARVVFREALQFFGARIVSGLLVLLGTWLMVAKLGMNEYLAKAFCSVFNLVFNYFASKFLVFRRRTEGEGSDRVKHGKRMVRLMYLTAFLVPAVIVAVIYICSEVWPFGQQCFLKTDMYHQYAPFFSEFRHKLANGESLLYSWNVGMGVNFAAVYAYYLASPFNWLVVLVSENHVIEFMNMLTILKIGLAGASFTFYLRRHSRDRGDYGPVFFGILYALSGYVCAYYWNTMWLDCILLFPLVAGAAEELIRSGRMFPYALCLGLCITTNYYISIMICIFLVFWFIAYNVIELPGSLKEFLKRAVRFGAASLIAGGMAAVLLLPAFCALQGSASAASKFPSTIREYFSVIEMLSRLQPAVQTEQVLEHWPNIYSGTFMFVLFPLYLMCRQISLREKAACLILALFLLAGFSINALDYLWHGLHFPNSLPCRQSFCFVFLLLFMGFRAYENRMYFGRKELGTALAAAAAFLLLCQKDADSKYFAFYVTWLALGLCAAYTLVLFLSSERKICRQTAFVSALFLVTAEASVNAALTGFTTCSRSYYTENNAAVRSLTEEAAPVRNEEDASAMVQEGSEETGQTVSFYRFELNDRRTKNDGAWLNFPSVSLFSSTAPSVCTKLMTKLGCEASTNAYSITGSTPLVNMLLAVRYGLYSTEQTSEEGRTLVDAQDKMFLYEFENTLPVGFILPQSLTDNWAFEFSEPALVQNSVCDCCGVPQVLVQEPAVGTDSGGTYSAYLSSDGEYYAYIGNTAVKSVTVSWKGEEKKFSNTDRKYLLELGDCSEGEYVKFTSGTEGEKLNVKIYRVDYDALRQLQQKLASQGVTVKEWDSASMEVSVSVDPAAMDYTGEEARLFFSIPYDSGWKVTVDGVETETKAVFNDTFLSVDVPAGDHTVKLTYEPEGLRAGLMISGVCWLLLAGLFLIDRKTLSEEKRRRRISRRRENSGAFPAEDSEAETAYEPAEEMAVEPAGKPEEKPAEEMTDEPASEPAAGQTAEAGSPVPFPDDPEHRSAGTEELP